MATSKETLALRDELIESISARLHITTDTLPGVQLTSGLSADTSAVVEAAEAVMPRVLAERQKAESLAKALEGLIAAFDDQSAGSMETAQKRAVQVLASARAHSSAVGRYAL